ncbi:bile acid:sodium symporter family protein [Solitalea canadensis]|uniref:Putative Na+-dependent transporter n=1 Tax=Solitalea canadensis (strain ATCC 29591 / DSM 3403 / JCM 21819 / LMG 8368 / NBRC 15130 / NCIMB 12057 / USAM 9D) TaxID=929556 RepID=H8KY32_SOLCM|nr:bile acid:sodium symporter family protein [Solitalea canadensis]AFD05770.1 putative Na+-dependent transporter [Solitalea canadensis DSM 3403]
MPKESSIKQIISKLGLDGFVLGILSVIVIAYFIPGPGIMQGPFSLKSIANYGASLIFFFYGLKLNRAKLKSGLSNWRLHLMVQASTYLIFPIVVFTVYKLFGNQNAHWLWVGVLFLSAIPSTVSSSVVMVSIGGGNIPGAIFNASISSLIGVFLTPFWMEIFFSSGSGTFDVSDVVLKLILQVLVPVILGLILNPKFGAFAEKHKTNLKYFDQTVILMIVYTSFSESNAGHVFEGYSITELLTLGALMVVLFFVVYYIISLCAYLLKFKHEDRVTAVFCGSKKSLVHGTVMSKIIFANNPSLGVILLPLMMYHALQLVICSFIAQKMAKRSKELEIAGN